MDAYTDDHLTWLPSDMLIQIASEVYKYKYLTSLRAVSKSIMALFEKRELIERLTKVVSERGYKIGSQLTCTRSNFSSFLT